MRPATKVMCNMRCSNVCDTRSLLFRHPLAQHHSVWNKWESNTLCLLTPKTKEKYVLVRRAVTMDSVAVQREDLEAIRQVEQAVQIQLEDSVVTQPVVPQGQPEPIPQRRKKPKNTKPENIPSRFNSCGSQTK